MAHEDFSRKLPARSTSNRAFGLMFTAILAGIGLLPLIRHHAVRGWALIAAAAFLGTALAAPGLLGPVKRVWMRFGRMMNALVAHVISAILLFVAFAPLRLCFRLAGQDPLALRWDARADTYWIRRDPPGPPPETMTQQF